MKKKKSFLESVTILEECDTEEKCKVVESLKPVFLKKEEVLFRQGDTGASLYIVKNGIIGAYTVQSDGSQRDVACFSSGKSFGEMAIIESMPRSTTCYAITNAELLMLEAISFYQLLLNYPEIGIKMIKGMIRNMISWLSEANNFLKTMVMWGEEARHRAITDELTGCFNRRFFEESIELNISQSRHKNSKFSLLILDLDNFRKINDRFGMNTGDEILKKIAHCFKSFFQHNATIYRIGGDEFAVLLKDISIKQALTIANNLVKKLNTEKLKIKSNLKLIYFCLKTSIGVAEYPRHGETAIILMDVADKALLHAKKTGKNKTICATQY